MELARVADPRQRRGGGSGGGGIEIVTTPSSVKMESFHTLQIK